MHAGDSVLPIYSDDDPGQTLRIGLVPSALLCWNQRLIAEKRSLG